MPYKDKTDQLNWLDKRRKENKKKLLQLKAEIGSCQKCGYNKHSEILQFHHRDPKNKKDNISNLSRGTYNWSHFEKEIAKCDLICPNCHYWFHYTEK